MMKQKEPAGKYTNPQGVAEGKAAVKIVRAWLGDVAFHEDPVGENSERIKILGPGYDADGASHYVDVRIYVPKIDIDLELEEAHEEAPDLEADHTDESGTIATLRKQVADRDLAIEALTARIAELLSHTTG